MTDESPPPTDLHQSLGQRRVVFMEGGRAQIEYNAGMHMAHSGGVIQGGFITGWIDAAMAHAAISQFGFDLTPMSLEIKVTFFAPARPGLVIAEGWIEKSGKTTCFAEGVLKDAAGGVLAKASSTLRLLPRAKVQSDAEAAGR
jgi:uncharacterized protein (TIGR00369 family)